MRIKKIAPVTPANGNIENSYGTSQENTYSQEYINNELKGIVEQISDNYIKIGNMKIVIGNVSYKTTTFNSTSNTYFTTVGIETPVDFTLGQVFCQLTSGDANRTLSVRPYGQIINGHHTDILIQSDIENYENSLDYLVIGK